MKQSQEQFVKDRLDRSGEISRNECLSNYITRLSSIIFNLKKEGYNFRTYVRDTTKPDGRKGKDFVYQVVKDETISLF